MSVRVHLTLENRFGRVSKCLKSLVTILCTQVSKADFVVVDKGWAFITSIKNLFATDSLST